ncbi:hypothetical protein BC943DRAFT_376709 [Umbelopsis sp. AD052]|nr:hypothetical protein BC943DRAFT_376709 [Umbelopsis sp. AD052]
MATIALVSLCIASVVDASPEFRPVEDYQRMNRRAESTTKEAAKTTTKKTTAKATTTKKPTTTKKASSAVKASSTSKAASVVVSSAIASSSLPGGIVIPTTTAATVTGVASPSPSTDPNASASSGLSGGAIGGIIGGVAVAAIGVGAFAFIRNKRKNKSAAPNYRRSMRQSMADPFSMGFVAPNKPQPMPMQDNPFPPAAPYERLEEPKSLGVYNVVSTYTPTLGDEIDIRSGDRIRVLVEYDDGWMLGENTSNGNAKGVFPRHCIDYPGNETYIQPAYTADDQNRPDSMLHWQ